MSLQPILLAIGSNLAGPDGRTPLVTCHDAVESLRALPGLRLRAVSRWYRSAAIPEGTPDYVNGVVLVEGSAAPDWLLAQLQALEARAGRVRGVANAARTLDLDIIDMGGLVRVAPDPVLPHPRAHLRAFVLRPLADVAPDWHHPVLKRSVAELLAALPHQAIELL